MLIRVFYYLKPLIPRNIQLYFRRILLTRKIKKYENIWPIYPGSEKKPTNWIGWPDEKKFAFILTHDVEHKKGYDQVKKLMEIEKELGFVSSFYFVPERDYKVEKTLLNTLKENGFEYGVHGLNHDGKLFSSEVEFFRRAKKINYYINKWGVVGFRAPAMHHNLDWIGELNIEYDLSTFDTDPFEPQPDGVGSIFPFWVPNTRHKNGGYIEMPYTVPQDFTPFILLKEKSIRIWKNKTDWIIKNNGMVLVNVHPDYINFYNKNEQEKFPISLYIDFLNYLKQNYNSQFWNPLPKELANYWYNKMVSVQNNVIT